MNLDDVNPRPQPEPPPTGAADIYRALLNAIDQGFCIVEATTHDSGNRTDYRFIEVNPAFERQTGLQDVQGKLMRDLSPQTEELWFELCVRVAAGGEPAHSVHHAAASNRLLDIHAFPIPGGNTNRIGILFSDITQRRHAEKVLSEREEQLRLIFESATEYAIVLSDCDRRVTGWNSGAERLLGYSDEEILGRSADVLFTPEDRATGQPQKEAALALRDGRAVNERWHLRKDGSRFWGSGLMFPLRNGAEQASGLLKIMRDRTSERRAEQVLRESEERLRLAMEAAEIGTWEYDPTTRTFRFDERTRALFGVPGGVEPGYEAFLAAIHPDDRTAVHESVERVLEGKAGGEFRQEFRAVRGNGGGDAWIRAAGGVRFDPAGKPAQFIGALIDITDLMKARDVLARRSEQLERDVEERTRQLRDLVQQLETFSYSIVHDLRAPLRSVKSFSAILDEEYGGQLDDRARDYLRRLQSSVTRMDALITDVLAYSRVTAMHAALTPVNLDQLVHELVEHYPQFEDSKRAIQIRSPLPAAMGNRVLLTQCISNLLGNALKFVPKDRKPQIVVRADSNRDTVRLWVEDNGIGVEPDYRNRIFDLFVRLHGTDQYTGTGVGLAIVAKAVERMRGKVGVESTPGEGSRFWIELEKPPSPATDPQKS